MHIEGLVCVENGVWVCDGRASGRGLGEGQGCGYNVNTVKTTNTKGRGKERGGPHPLKYILFQLVVLLSYCRLKTGNCADSKENSRSGFANYYKFLLSYRMPANTDNNVGRLTSSVYVFLYNVNNVCAVHV